MRVAEYREMIDDVSGMFTSLKSVATPAERFAEARRLEVHLGCLTRADCPRAKLSDRNRAQLLAHNIAAYLDASGLRSELDAARRSDATLARLAFAGEWK